METRSPNRPESGTNALPVTSESTSCCRGIGGFAKGCCGGVMSAVAGTFRGRKLATLFATTTAVAICAAAYFAGQASVASQQAAFEFPPIDATSALTSEKFSIAVGPMSGQGDGLFVLDHNSGLLKCSVLYPRSAAFGAVYQANVAEVLASGGKGGKYLMVVGRTEFPSTSARPAAPAVVYVMDSTTGNYACYGIPFNRSAVNANNPQQGAMVLLATGTANPIADRDGGR